jgi:DNA mismatch endonuclease (patch repair protein)
MKGAGDRSFFHGIFVLRCLVPLCTLKRQMTDTMSPEERSCRMALVRSIDTKPEMFVRKLVYKMGYRYRLHCTDLPGRPDIVFRSSRAVIFVHGCFWHRHENCSLARLPKSRVVFWTTKLEGNRERDVRKLAALKDLGWRVARCLGM